MNMYFLVLFYKELNGMVFKGNQMISVLFVLCLGYMSSAKCIKSY